MTDFIFESSFNGISHIQCRVINTYSCFYSSLFCCGCVNLHESHVDLIIVEIMERLHTHG